MSEPRKPTKAELERIVSSKPRARKEVGYFTDAGEFRNYRPERTPLSLARKVVRT